MRPLLALLLAPALAACSSGLPSSVEATSCETVLLSPGAPSGADVTWSVEGYPLLLVAPNGDRGEVRFEAPAVARPETFTLRMRYPNGGSTVERSVDVTVTPRAPAAGFPEGMAPGCAPFAHGVSSGDPRPDGVLLWTRSTPTGEGELTLRYEVATDPQMREVVTSGEVVTGPARDFTATVDVTGLRAGTTYYYRFLTDAGISSPLGRTRTAPDGATDHLRFATVSCSSIYSGWFNAYRRIAERRRPRSGRFTWATTSTISSTKTKRCGFPSPTARKASTIWPPGARGNAYYLGRPRPSPRAGDASVVFTDVGQPRRGVARARERLRGVGAGLPRVEPDHGPA